MPIRMLKSKTICPNFYRIKSGKKLFSFNEDIGLVPILGLPLALYQLQTIEALGAKLFDISNELEIKESEYFIFDEDLVFTPEFVKATINSALTKRTSFRTILNQNAFNERFSLPHSLEGDSHLKFNFYYRNKINAGIEEMVIPQKTFKYSITLPNQIVLGGQYHFDQCDTLISRIASPFHLLQINIAINFSRLIKIRNLLPDWAADKIAPNNSWLRNKRFKSLNRFGKFCKIHPKAIIENAILGDNVTIGANVIIRHSIIGDGCNINDSASIVNSVLGKRNTIASGNHINLCLTYDDVYLIHGPYQLSVFGLSSAVFAVINCDIRLDQKTISIPTDIGILDSKQPLLGIAYGHYSKVGGGNIIASGRIVPNDKIIAPPETIILKFD